VKASDVAKTQRMADLKSMVLKGRGASPAAAKAAEAAAALKPPPLPAGAGAGATKAVTTGLTKTTSGLTKFGKQLVSNVKTLSVATKVAGGVGIALAAVGLAAKALGSKLEQSGNEVGGTALTMAGSFAEFGATVAGFAALGSIIPGVGTAIGAAVGVVVASFMQLDDVGESVARFGKSLGGTVKVAGKEISKFGPKTQKFGKWLEGTGNILAETGRNMKDFAKGVARGAWEAIKFTTGIKAVEFGFEALVDATRSDEYKQALKDSAAAAKELKGPMEELKRASDEYGKSLNAEVSRQAASGLSLQKSMKRLEAVTKSAKFQLADFENEVAGIRIDAFSNIGGSIAAFNDAIKRSSASVTSRFQMMTKTLADERVRIAKDGKLQGEQRRQALMVLHKAELEAVKTFIDGMNKVIEAMFQSPKILQAELKAEIAKIKIEAPMEAGAVSAGDLFKNTEEQLKSLEAQQEANLQARRQAEQALADMQVKLVEQQKKAIEGVEKSIAEMGDEAKKAFTASGFVKETKDGLKINEEKARETYDAASKNLDELKKKYDEVAKALPPDSFAGMATNLTAANNAVREYEKGLGESRKALDKAKKSGKGIDVAAKDVEAAQKGLQEAMDAQNDAQEKMRDMVQEAAKSANVKIDKDMLEGAFTAISASMASGKDLADDSLIEAGKNSDDLKKIMGQLKKSMGGNNKRFEEVRRLAKEMTVSSDLQDASGAIVDNMDGQTNQLKIIKDAEQKQAEIQCAIGDAMNQITKILETEGIQNLKKQLDGLKMEEAIAEQLGDPTKAINDVIRAQTELTSQELDALDKASKVQEGVVQGEKDKLVEAEKALAAAEEVAKSKKKEDELNRDAAKKTAETAKTTLKQAQKAAADLKKQREEIARELPKIGESISKALEAFQNSLTGRRIAAKFDLTDAMSEMAEFSDDLAGTMKEATEIAISVVKERRDAEVKIIEETLAREEENIKAREALAKTPEEKKRVRAEGDATKETIKRTEFAKAEVKYKKAVVDQAAKEKDLRTRQADMVQDSIGQEMDFLSEIGGSFSRLVELQGMSLGIEKQKLDYAKDYLAEVEKSGVGGMKLLEAQLGVRNQEFALQKKGMGLQKSIMDKMLGAAFGQLKDFGARKQMATDVSLMGVGGTRVKTPSGMYMAGGGGTPEERALQRQMGATGVRGAFSGGLAGLGLPGAAGAPERLPIEKAMEEGLRVTGIDKSTEDTANNTRGLGKRGSGYVTDEKAQGLLSSILEVLTGILDVVKGTAGTPAAKENVKAATEVSKATNSVASKVEDVKKAVDTSSTSAQKESAGATSEKMGEGIDAQLKLAKKDFRLALKEYELSKKDNKAGKKELAAVQNSYGKVASLEAAVRTREMSNPMAGAFEGMVDEYDRVMAGKMIPEMEQFTKETADASQQTKDSSTKDKKSKEQSVAVASKLSEKMSLTGGKFDDTAKMGGGGKAMALGGQKNIKGVGEVSELAKKHAKAFGNSMAKESKSVSKTTTKDLSKSLSGPMSMSETFNKPGAYEEQRNKDLAKALEPSESSGEMAKSIKGLADEGLKSGSIYVSDIEGNAILSSILQSISSSPAVSAVGGPGGAGAMGSPATVESVQVRGEINVHFDSKLFKTEMKTLVAEIIRTPEIIKGLAQTGVLVQQT
jgi:hypothetical protein